MFMVNGDRLLRRAGKLGEIALHCQTGCWKTRTEVQIQRDLRNPRLAKKIEPMPFHAPPLTRNPKLIRKNLL
jgi:hypothetical protein